MYRRFRDECHALIRDELDLVVKGQLRALVHNDKMTQKTKSQNAECVRRNFVLVVIVCDTFCFLHTMNHKRLECIKTTWMVNDLGPQNRVQHLPYNTTPLSDIQQFV